MDEILSMFPTCRKDLGLEILDSKLLTPALAKLFDNIIEETLQIKKETIEGTSASANPLVKIESLLDYIWEHLHTGEWKSIDIFWRYLYSYASLFKTFSILTDHNVEDRKSNFVKAISACDMGLIMGAPILGGLHSKIAKSLNEIIVESFDDPRCSSSETKNSEIAPMNVDPLKSVDSFHVPSIEMFLSEIMDKTPAIFTGNSSLT